MLQDKCVVPAVTPSHRRSGWMTTAWTIRSETVNRIAPPPVPTTSLHQPSVFLASTFKAPTASADPVCVAVCSWLTCSTLPLCLCTQPYSLPPQPTNPSTLSPSSLPCSNSPPPFHSISPVAFLGLPSSVRQGCGHPSAQTGGTACPLLLTRAVCVTHRLWCVSVFYFYFFGGPQIIFMCLLFGVRTQSWAKESGCFLCVWCAAF